MQQKSKIHKLFTRPVAVAINPKIEQTYVHTDSHWEDLNSI